MTQREIANKLGFSRQYLFEILSGKYTVNDRRLMKLLYFYPDLEYEKVETKYRIKRRRKDDNSSNNI